MKKIIWVCFTLLFVNEILAQKSIEKEKIFTKENAFVAVSGSFNIATNNGGGTLLALNPMYGYYIKEWLDVGAVVNLQYNSFVFDYTALSNGRQKKSFLAGIGVSSRIYPIDFLYIQVQPELNLVSSKEVPITILGASGATLKYSNLVPSLLMGAGMKRGFTKGRNFYFASILFDVLGGSNSPYRTLTALGNITGNIIPVYRVGINLSLSELSKK